MALISLIHPSRGRPTKACETSKEWIKNCGVSFEYILSCDSDDTSLHQYDPLDGAQNLRRIVNQNSSVVEATNKAAKVSNGDILIYLSDDFKCFPGWGIEIEKQFEGVTEPMLLKVDDCLQPFNVAVLTIPIMNRALYNRLGYFWNPEYKSMFVDEDLYWTAKKLGALKFAPQIKFEHAHVSVGKAENDETYKRSSANWDHGKKTFAKRRAAGFPV